MTAAEMLATAKRLGVPVLLVDTRPITQGVLVDARRTQARAWAEWLSEHGARHIRLDDESRVHVGPKSFSVEELRELLLGAGPQAVLRHVAIHAQGLYVTPLWHWYAQCAADSYRTEAEDVLLQQVGEALKEAGVDLGLPPVPREATP